MQASRSPKTSLVLLTELLKISGVWRYFLSFSNSRYLFCNAADGRSVYVKNLPMTITAQQLETEFARFGAVKENGVNVKSQKVLTLQNDTDEYFECNCLALYLSSMFVFFLNPGSLWLQ